MYNPPRKNTEPNWKNFEYHEEYLMVYEQGREAAKQKKLFVNPYKKTVNNDPHGYNCDLTKVISFEDELSSWYFNGYYDYQFEDDKPKTDSIQVPIKIDGEFDVYFPPAGGPRGDCIITPKVKKARKKPVVKKKLNLKTIETRLKEFEGKEMTY